MQIPGAFLRHVKQCLESCMFQIWAKCWMQCRCTRKQPYTCVVGPQEGEPGCLKGATNSHFQGWRASAGALAKAPEADAVAAAHCQLLPALRPPGKRRYLPLQYSASDVILASFQFVVSLVRQLGPPDIANLQGMTCMWQFCGRH